MIRATATAPGPAVLTERLGKTYPDGTVAVADLSLAVRRGEVLGLLGPNGAGKSTTAGMLTTTAATARAAADRLLDQVSLAHAAGKRVDELSGGMAQRLMVARAIMHGPEVLFLDEPTAGLDPQSRLAVHGIITGLKSAGQTIMLITHDMTEADTLADRVAIIDHGRLLALDTPAELKRSVRGGTPTLETVFIQFTGKELRES